MGYQFARVNDYSQYGSSRNPNPKTTSGCLGEAYRDEGFASHVKEPRKPLLLLGSREDIDNAINNFRKNYRDCLGHKLRKDGKELLAGVVSWPPGSTRDNFWETLPVVLFFLMKKYGKSLRCCLFHEDELYLDEKGKYHGQTHFHVHFFVVPEPHENFRDYHEGIYAKWKAKKEGLNHWEGDLRYKWAMGDWQKEFYNEVSFPLGWEKERPKELKEKRLNNREQKIINNAKKTAIKIKEDAKKKAENTINIANEKAKAISNEANKKAERIIFNANEKANLNSQTANDKLENAKKVEEENNKLKTELEIQKDEQDKIKIELDYREKSINGAKKAISDMKQKLPSEDRIGVSVISVLNTENVAGKERDEFYKIFFNEISNFVKEIINRIRHIPEQNNKQDKKKNKKIIWR